MQPGDANSIINEKGCVQAGEEWLEQNLVLVAGVLVGIAFMQVGALSLLPLSNVVSIMHMLA